MYVRKRGDCDKKGGDAKYVQYSFLKLNLAKVFIAPYESKDRSRVRLIKYSKTVFWESLYVFYAILAK